MNEIEVQTILDQAQIARANPANFNKQELRMLKRQLHQLAESKSLPAKEFFLSCLLDSDSDWRLNGLRNLGFHYPFDPVSEISTQIRTLLLEDTDDDVRSCAALVLGGRSQGLDLALLEALQSDPSEYVRGSAFIALLELVGVPFAVTFGFGEKVYDGEIESTLAEIKRITAEYGIDIEQINTL